MACVWNGVNSVSGAQCVYVMLHAIFPGIARIPNHMSSGSALTSASMISIGMLALTMKLAGGAGPVVTRKASVSGSTKTWLLVKFIFTTAASCSTFASNAADWQRNATKPSDPILGQLIGFPLANLFVQVIGMVVASTSEAVYVSYLDRILEDNYSAKYRAATFFIAAGFAYSLLFSWYLLGSASIFITVLASYQIFLFSRIAPNFVGFLNNFGVVKGEAIAHSYYFALFTTSFAAGASYYLLAKLFPQANSRIGSSWNEPKGVWEPEPLPADPKDSSFEEEEKEKEKDGPGDALASVALV
ncbi:hypothetical protein RQP46_005386 [Phenoliferia psychrophenolica]